MKPFNDYEKVQAFSDLPQLPAGGYVAKIMGAEVVEYDNYSKLLISVDITEGEYKDYYANQYRANTSADRKWKGVVRLSIPTDDGSDADVTTKRIFKGCIEAVEDSNSGYRWDWNEAGLKGKTVGLLVRMKEWEYNGKHGWAPECFKLIGVDLIRSGKFKVPADKPLNGSTATSATSTATGGVISTDDDLPF